LPLNYRTFELLNFLTFPSAVGAGAERSPTDGVGNLGENAGCGFDSKISPRSEETEFNLRSAGEGAII